MPPGRAQPTKARSRRNSRPRRLVVLLSDVRVATVDEDQRGRYTLTYEDSWLENKNAYPLSLSLPLTARIHADTAHRAPLRSFMDGLLPDGLDVRARLGREHGVASGNPFALLSAIGEDCPGAVQFITPERADELEISGLNSIEWITEADVARRLRQVRTGLSTGRLEGDPGQFSLPGAQPKIALVRREDQWGIPTGRTPTNCILKPPTGRYDGIVENELVCGMIASELGVPTADASVHRFRDEVGEELAFVTDRYDRFTGEDGLLRRIHQEDCCQALGVPPRTKYEQDGGPAAKDIVALLDTHSYDAAEDVTAFIDALALNWVLVGTDAHAKNYSILFRAGGVVRLAPLYDVISGLPYREIWNPSATTTHDQPRLAMSIGGERGVLSIRRSHWERFARDIRRDPEALTERARAIVRVLPDVAAAVTTRLASDGVDDDVVQVIARGIVDRCAQCELVLNAASR